MVKRGVNLNDTLGIQSYLGVPVLLLFSQTSGPDGQPASLSIPFVDARRSLTLSLSKRSCFSNMLHLLSGPCRINQSPLI